MKYHILKVDVKWSMMYLMNRNTLMGAKVVTHVDFLLRIKHDIIRAEPTVDDNDQSMEISTLKKCVFAGV